MRTPGVVAGGSGAGLGKLRHGGGLAGNRLESPDRTQESWQAAASALGLS